MTTDAMLFGERRQFFRKECLRIIYINDYSKSYTGHLRDLALGGAFVEPAEKNHSEIGQKLQLSIPFGLKEGAVHIHAEVVWTRYNGVGLRFLNQNIGHSAVHY